MRAVGDELIDVWRFGMLQEEGEGKSGEIKDYGRDFLERENKIKIRKE